MSVKKNIMLAPVDLKLMSKEEAEKKAKERMKALKDGTFEKRVGRRGYKPHGEDPDANVDKNTNSTT